MTTWALRYWLQLLCLRAFLGGCSPASSLLPADREAAVEARVGALDVLGNESDGDRPRRRHRRGSSRLTGSLPAQVNATEAAAGAAPAAAEAAQSDDADHGREAAESDSGTSNGSSDPTLSPGSDGAHAPLTAPGGTQAAGGTEEAEHPAHTAGARQEVSGSDDADMPLTAPGGLQVGDGHEDEPAGGAAAAPAAANPPPPPAVASPLAPVPAKPAASQPKASPGFFLLAEYDTFIELDLRPAFANIEQSVDDFLNTAMQAASTFTAEVKAEPTPKALSDGWAALLNSTWPRWTRVHKITRSALQDIMSALRDLGDIDHSIVGSDPVMKMQWAAWTDIQGDFWHEHQTNLERETLPLFQVDALQQLEKAPSSIANQKISLLLLRLERTVDRVGALADELLNDMETLLKEVLRKADAARALLPLTRSAEETGADPEGRLKTAVISAVFKMRLGFSEILDGMMSVVPLFGISPVLPTP